MLHHHSIAPQHLPPHAGQVRPRPWRHPYLYSYPHREAPAPGCKAAMAGAWWLKAENLRLWGGLWRAPEAKASFRDARAALGVRRSGLSLQMVQAGRWGRVVRQGTGHFKPAVCRPQPRITSLHQLRLELPVQPGTQPRPPPVGLHTESALKPSRGYEQRTATAVGRKTTPPVEASGGT